jgi:threonine dehydrogenase-like Zn-dependent dehydrogenase
MQAVRIIGTEAALVEVDEPSGTGEVLEVVSSSICGTDLGLVAAGAQGFTLGHEFTVRRDGAVYAVEPTVYCGRCAQCEAGHTQRCTGEHADLGIFVDGGLAERALVRPSALVPLPDGLGPVEACLVEPAAVAWHGVRRAGLTGGERAVVVGGGSIGLLTVAALAWAGHPVDLDARHPHQRAAGERLGAGAAHGLYDVVFDAAGTESGLARAVELAAPGGRVVLLGVYYGTLPISGTDILVKELTCIPAMAYGRHDGTRETVEAATMLAQRPEIADALITHRFALSEAAQAFAVAADRAAGAIKVVMEPA